MVKKTLLQWRWALEGPAQLDNEFGTSTLEEKCTTVPNIQHKEVFCFQRADFSCN